MVQIKIQQFEGPLDLLLQLIEEEKLNINEISLATVTEQFLRHLRSLQTLRPHDLADWLVIAAKLLVIKSRTLIPSLELDAEETETGSGLAWQLYQYKRYKETARHLARLESLGKQGWARRQALFAQRVSFYPDPGVTPAALRDALRFVLKSLQEIAALPKRMLGEVVTITEKIDHLQRLIAEKVELTLQDLVTAAKSRTEVIVTFLALLELVKQKILTVEQEAIFSEILIKKK